MRRSIKNSWSSQDVCCVSATFHLFNSICIFLLRLKQRIAKACLDKHIGRISKSGVLQVVDLPLFTKDAILCCFFPSQSPWTKAGLLAAKTSHDDGDDGDHSDGHADSADAAHNFGFNVGRGELEAELSGVVRMARNCSSSSGKVQGYWTSKL